MIAHIGRGPRTDDAISWLADKPLPEDPRWPDGSVLSDVVDFLRSGRNWLVMTPGRIGVDEVYSWATLVEEIRDAIRIHDGMLETIDGDDARDVRAARRVLVRLLGRVEVEG